jgi:hypothetical protein
MGVPSPKIPEPQETPGVVIGSRGFTLSRRIAKLTGQPAANFRIQAATTPDPVSFLSQLLRRTERDVARERREQAAADRAAREAGRAAQRGSGGGSGGGGGGTGGRAPEEAPTRADPDVQEEAARTVRNLARRARGRASTILTSPGISFPNLSTVRKTLLGGFG